MGSISRVRVMLDVSDPFSVGHFVPVSIRPKVCSPATFVFAVVIARGRV